MHFQVTSIFSRDLRVLEAWGLFDAEGKHLPLGFHKYWLVFEKSFENMLLFLTVALPRKIYIQKIEGPKNHKSLLNLSC